MEQLVGSSGRADGGGDASPFRGHHSGRSDPTSSDLLLPLQISANQESSNQNQSLPIPNPRDKRKITAKYLEPEASPLGAGRDWLGSARARADWMKRRESLAPPLLCCSRGSLFFSEHGGKEKRRSVAVGPLAARARNGVCRSVGRPVAWDEKWGRQN